MLAPLQTLAVQLGVTLMTIRIATLLTAGVAIGVTLGAMTISVLPIWLGIGVIAAVGYVATLA